MKAVFNVITLALFCMAFAWLKFGGNVKRLTLVGSEIGIFALLQWFSLCAQWRKSRVQALMRVVFVEWVVSGIVQPLCSIVHRNNGAVLKIYDFCFDEAETIDAQWRKTTFQGSPQIAFGLRVVLLDCAAIDAIDDAIDAYR